MSEYSKGYADGLKDATDSGIELMRSLARSLRLEQLAWCGACLTLGYRACAAEYSWVLFFGSALSAIAAALLFVMMRRAK